MSDTEKGKAWKKRVSNEKYSNGWDHVFGKKKARISYEADFVVDRGYSVQCPFCETYQTDMPKTSKLDYNYGCQKCGQTMRVIL